MSPEKIFRGIEIKSDQSRLIHMIPDGFQIDEIPSKPILFFKKYGIRVSSVFSEIYYRYNGIKDEKYITPGLYYYYINPYLMNLNLYKAYDDKNVYQMLFPFVKQPDTIIRCMNGRLFVPKEGFLFGEEISVKQALFVLKEYEQFIIKPSFDSGNGRNVRLVEVDKTKIEEIEQLLVSYGENYIIQKVLKNHKDLSLLNSSSFNTCRLITYRRVDSDEYVLLASMVRFGKEGSVFDNAGAGGGFCKINRDGKVDDIIHEYKSFESRSLYKEKGIKDLYIPNWKKMIEVAISLHRSLPYFDLIGWDLSVDEYGDIVMIEYNYAPTIESIQITNGPLFGQYTDELMSKLTHPVTETVNVLRRGFADGKKSNDYIFDLGKINGL